jgi:hypothetical protein
MLMTGINRQKTQALCKPALSSILDPSHKTKTTNTAIRKASIIDPFYYLYDWARAQRQAAKISIIDQSRARIPMMPMPDESLLFCISG